MKYSLLKYAILLQTALAILASNTTAAPVGTGFSYQGRLAVAGSGANGSYDLKLSLHDALSGGLQVGTSLTNLGVGVSNGLFTTTLDFGAGIFAGQALWLEIGVRTNGVGAFTTLAPRQSLAPTPYSISANSLSGNLPATQLTGVLPPSALGGTYSGAVVFNNSGNAFSGSGSGLSGVNAATLGGFGPGSFWKLLGNGGTTSANFLGTTDKQSLELRANNIPMFRLQTTYWDYINIVAGYGCEVEGITTYASTISGGMSNRILDASAMPTYGSTISGGRQNQIYGGSDTISGGLNNMIGHESDSSTISGGRANQVDASVDSVIGGGQNNQIRFGQEATINGGAGNAILAPTGFFTGGTISGGGSNQISTSPSYPGHSPGNYQTIGGGSGNSIYDSTFATISGGSGNLVPGAIYGTVAGGSGNQLGIDAGDTQASFSAIGGGSSNVIWGAENATISGGKNNQITRTGNYVSDNSFIGGGFSNQVTGCKGATVGGGVNNFVGGCPGGTIAGGAENINFAYYATIAGGLKNIVGGSCDIGTGNPYSVISGGFENVIYEGLGGSTIAGGYHNGIIMPFQAFGKRATISGGESNVINASYSTIPGGVQARTSNFGQMAHASGQFGSAGDAQTSVYVCRGTSTSATPAELFLDGISQRLTMPTNSTWAVDILVTGRAADGTSAAYQLQCAAKNNGGITTLGAARKQTILAEDVASWDATVVAFATNNTLSIQATGAAGVSIRWVATVRTAEVIY